MASLFFKYSTMNAGKSTALLQASHNYIESGMHTMLITAAIDDRYAKGQITSRLGIAADAHLFSGEDNLLEVIQAAHVDNPIDCVLVDESQFLTKEQVRQLAQVVDKIKIPVMCYGLRTDFQGELFTGSQYLLAWADNLEELKTICHCGKKATMVMRLDEAGKPIQDGEQVAIGGNDIYKPVCRRHFQESMWDLK